MYHRTLEAHRLQDAVDLAFMRSEAEADAADETALDVIDRASIGRVYLSVRHLSYHCLKIGEMIHPIKADLRYDSGVMAR